MRNLVWGLCLGGLVLALVSGVVLMGALGESRQACPDSDQCADAISAAVRSAAVSSGVLTMIFLGAALIGLRRLKIR